MVCTRPSGSSGTTATTGGRAGDAISTATDGGRGALIVMEGCDKAGKTTQANMLVKALTDAGKPTVFMRFPDRSTKIGGIIDGYLSCDTELDDRAIHLLFSANRWESVAKIKSTIKEGTNIVIDRYAFSGVAFSAAKEGMCFEWCKKCDAGLPKPDLVLYLSLSPENAQTREQYGEERYENMDFQKRVQVNYEKLKDSTWKVIDAKKSIGEVQEVIKAEVLKTIDTAKDEKLKTLWTA